MDTVNNDEWKKLQEKGLSNCDKGEHIYVSVSEKCVICGKERKP